MAALDQGLQHVAQLLADAYGFSPHTPGSGAAGGVAGTMMTVLGAELVSGAELIFDLLKVEERIADADAVVTGEGRTDAQTLQGKLVYRLARLAQTLHTPCAALSGSITHEDQIRSQLPQLLHYPLAKTSTEIADALARPEWHAARCLERFIADLQKK